MKERLPVNDCPLHEQSIDSDCPKFVEQSLPLRDRSSELYVSQLKKSALWSEARGLCPYICHDDRRSEEQDRAAPVNPRHGVSGFHSKPRNESKGEDHTWGGQRIVDGVTETGEQFYCVSRSVVDRKSTRLNS